MKGLKKLVLVTAIAATPLVASAQLKALNDSTLGSVTGQAGVTVEVQTQIGIGSIVYTDTDGFSSGNSGSAGAGQFIVQNVAIGGAGAAFSGIGITSAGLDYSNATAQTTTTSATGQGTTSDCTGAGGFCALDDLAFDIDVDGNGTAVVGLKNYDYTPVDFGVAIDKMGTAGTHVSGNTTAQDLSAGTVLLSNFRMAGSLAALGITVGKNTDAFDAMNTYASNLAAGAPSGSPVATALGYVSTEASLLNGTLKTENQDGSNTNNNDVLAMTAAFTVDQMQFDAPLMATSIHGMTVKGFGGAPVVVAMAVYAGGSLSTMTSAPAHGGNNVLRIDLETSPMDVKIGDPTSNSTTDGVVIGGTSIGAVAINGLTLTNTRLAVYGH